MAVYVDKMRAKFKGMVMCHMMADSLDELHEMADKIGVSRRHFQDGTHKHYDICLSKKALAIKYGAREVGNKELIEVMRRNNPERAKRMAEITEKYRRNIGQGDER